MRFLLLTKSVFLFAALLSCGMACNPVVEDPSAFASDSGQATIVLGGCSADFNVGWDHCLLERGQVAFPTLRFIVTNAADWAVGDCNLGLYKTGSTPGADLVEVDLGGLKDQINSTGLCLLKIETLEHYPDPKDPKQFRSIFMSGGFFIEALAPGYIPAPDPKVLSFCTTVKRTNKGRTTIESCKP